MVTNMDKVNMKTHLRNIPQVKEVLKFEKVKVPKEIQRLADEREKARKEKKWKLADELREKINKLDFVLEDSPNGPILKRK